MASFIARVELHGGTADDYEILHKWYSSSSCHVELGPGNLWFGGPSKLLADMPSETEPHSSWHYINRPADIIQGYLYQVDFDTLDV